MGDDGLDDEIDRVYRTVDNLLLAGRFLDVDELLDSVDVVALPVVISLSYATITFVARDVLRSRAAFMARLRRHLDRVEPSRVEALLSGLEA